MIIIHAYKMIIMHACMMIILHACIMIIIHFCRGSKGRSPLVLQRVQGAQSPSIAGGPRGAGPSIAGALGGAAPNIAGGPGGAAAQNCREGWGGGARPPDNRKLIIFSPEIIDKYSKKLANILTNN